MSPSAVPPVGIEASTPARAAAGSRALEQTAIRRVSSGTASPVAVPHAEQLAGAGTCADPQREDRPVPVRPQPREQLVPPLVGHRPRRPTGTASPVAAGHEIPQEPPDRLHRTAVRTDHQPRHDTLSLNDPAPQRQPDRGNVPLDVSTRHHHAPPSERVA